jgi:hypothetical protein
MLIIYSSIYHFYLLVQDYSYDLQNNVVNQMSQQLEKLSSDTGTLTVNISNQRFNIPVFDKESLQVAVATLNMLARKFKLKINSQELPKEETKVEPNSSASNSNPATTKALTYIMMAHSTSKT